MGWLFALVLIGHGTLLFVFLFDIPA